MLDINSTNSASKQFILQSTVEPNKVDTNGTTTTYNSFTLAPTGVSQSGLRTLSKVSFFKG